MMIEELKRNGNLWPSEWDELREAYSICIARSGKPWTFEHLRDSVDVDWNTTPEEIVKAYERDNEPPLVVRPKDGPMVYWDERDPNERIVRYLIDSQKISTPRK